MKYVLLRKELKNTKRKKSNMIHVIHQHPMKQRVLKIPEDKVIVDKEFSNEFSEYELLPDLEHVVVNREEFEKVLKKHCLMI